MKTITIKSYTGTTFNGIIKDMTFDSFTAAKNSGLGQCAFRLARAFDAFNPSGDVSLGNKIEVRIYDKDAAGGVLIYSGYIEQQKPSIDGGQESVEIICVGNISKLASDVLKNGAQTTLYTDTTAGLSTSAATAAEIQKVVKAIIDRYNAENGVGSMHYSTDGGTESVAATGSNMNYKFEALTYLQAIQKCKDIAPQNYYFYIGPDGTIYFKGQPTSATHTFTVGKNIKSIQVQKGIDSLKNILLLYAPNISGGAVYKQYKDDASISLYTRRVQQQTESNLQDTASMDNLGNSFINENKDPRIRVIMEIADNNENSLGYDIESIQPGDTCKITGIAYGTLLTDNMVIQEVEWQLGKATITIETREDFDMDTFLLKLNQDVQGQQQSGILASYT